MPGKTLTFSSQWSRRRNRQLTHRPDSTLSYRIPAATLAGNEPITVTFAGDSSDSASSGSATLTVLGVPTAISVKNVSGAANAVVTLDALLTRTDTGAHLAGKTLTFSVNGTVVGTASTYTSANSTLSYRIPAGALAGNETITVTFAAIPATEPRLGRQR